jgi:hypothetical protein
MNLSAFTRMTLRERIALEAALRRHDEEEVRND